MCVIYSTGSLTSLKRDYSLLHLPNKSISLRQIFRETDRGANFLAKEGLCASQIYVYLSNFLFYLVAFAH